MNKRQLKEIIRVNLEACHILDMKFLSHKCDAYVRAHPMYIEAFEYDLILKFLDYKHFNRITKNYDYGNHKGVFYERLNKKGEVINGVVIYPDDDKNYHRITYSKWLTEIYHDVYMEVSREETRKRLGLE